MRLMFLLRCEVESGHDITACDDAICTRSTSHHLGINEKLTATSIAAEHATNQSKADIGKAVPRPALLRSKGWLHHVAGSG